jgi:multidrug efflux system outer membrane protein
VDVLQQRDILLRTQAQRPLVTQRVALFEHQIAVLIREAPGVDVASAPSLPDPPPLPTVPVPARILEQRPDVRAAHLRLRAADHRIAVAIANRLPALRLTANYGFQSFDIAEFFRSNVWGLAAELVGVALDGGRLQAEIDRARAGLEERIAALGQVTLTALREVEDALVREARQVEHLTALEAQHAVAVQLVEDSKVRYVEGVGDYLPVLTALRQLQTLDQQILSARRQRIADRVALHRALAGDWGEVLGHRGRQDLATATPPAQPPGPSHTAAAARPAPAVAQAPGELR